MMMTEEEYAVKRKEESERLRFQHLKHKLARVDMDLPHLKKQNELELEL